jgi:putative thioredoxin
MDVSEVDFDNEVLNYSLNTPVIVDFWAEWCGPCKTIGPILEKLAEEGQGSFRMARVDVDANPNLPIRYGVRSIPTIKAFLKGQVVAELTGAQSEFRLREFIHNLAPNPSDLQVEKGNALIAAHAWKEAEKTFRQVLETDEGHPGALLGLIKCFLVEGKAREALVILKAFPSSQEYTRAESLRPLAETMLRLDTDPAIPEDPLEAALQNNVRLVKRGNILAAVDGLLDILRTNKKFHNGLARELVLALLEILGEDDPQTRQYRAELANILF